MPTDTPFGKKSRIRILKQHLAEKKRVTTANAWEFVYEELLWIDDSTGLAHLYESDKAQPGRPWYDRTITFTNMLCERFGRISQEELRHRIDRLFRAILAILAARSDRQSSDPLDDDLQQNLALPEMVDEVWATDLAGAETLEELAEETYHVDASLGAEFITLLHDRLGIEANEAQTVSQDLVEKARFYFTVGRKRQNVLGEGFEDLLQLLMTNISGVPEKIIVIRERANELPGFRNPNSTRTRFEAPDMAIVSNGRTELLASVKWSLRHDRQKQLSDELDCYVDLLSQEKFPRYILITNEYDPGRLVNTDGLQVRGQKIDCIYHVNLELLLGVLTTHGRVDALQPIINAGRLKSLETFLIEMATNYGRSSAMRDGLFG